MCVQWDRVLATVQGRSKRELVEDGGRVAAPAKRLGSMASGYRREDGRGPRYSGPVGLGAGDIVCTLEGELGRKRAVDRHKR